MISAPATRRNKPMELQTYRTDSEIDPVENILIDAALCSTRKQAIKASNIIIN